MSINQQMNGMNQFKLLGYSYDLAGNVLNDGNTAACPGPASYSFNAEEQETCAAGVTYTYDGDGTRVKKSSGTLYWGAGPLAESDLSGNLTSEYIFLNGKRIARRDVPTGNVYYYFSDHLGSSNVVTDSSGNIQNESDYYPFGGEGVITQNLSNQKYKFTGKERDTESGNDYFGARYYASSMGRYLSPDWSKNPQGVPYADFTNPQTLNLYSYVKNNPLSAFDDDGHATIEVKYNPLSLGSNHSFIVITDRDGTQTVFRAGPSISAGTGWITPATGGSASQSATPTSSQSDSSNSSSPGAGQTAQGNPWGQLYAQQESPTDPNGDNMSTISGSTTVLSNDLPASSYIQGLQQFDTGLNQTNIPYNPLSTNSNAYVTNALQSIGVPTPKAPVWAPGAGTNLNVTPAPPAPPPPPPPPCSVAGACSQPQSH